MRWRRLFFTSVVVGAAMSLQRLYGRGRTHHYSLQKDLLHRHHGEFDDPEAALGTNPAASPVDARSAYPGALAATIARFPDGVQVSAIECRDAATARRGIMSYLRQLPAHNIRPTSNGVRFAIDDYEVGQVVWMDQYIFIFIGPNQHAVQQRLDATPALHAREFTSTQSRPLGKRHEVRGLVSR